MDAISQMTFSIAFSCMKMSEFWLKFHWNLFPRVKLTVQATSHYLNQWWLVYWRIYASFGLNELSIFCWDISKQGNIMLVMIFNINSRNGLLLNPLWSSGAIWWHRSRYETITWTNVDLSSVRSSYVHHNFTRDPSTINQLNLDQRLHF